MVLHKNLTTDHLHDPKGHTHIESEITDLGDYLTEADADLLYSVLAHDHVVADITDFDPTDYLPLTAGPTKPLTGSLEINAASTPYLMLSENGVAGSDATFYETANDLFIRKRELAGQCNISIDAVPADFTGNSWLQMFRYTNTVGNRLLKIYEGSGAANVQHEFNAGTGDVDLCQQAGDLIVHSGDIKLKGVSPYLTLTDDTGSAASYTRLYDVYNDNNGYLIKVMETGDATLELDAKPTDGTSHAKIEMFGGANTTGADSGLYIFNAVGTDTEQHVFLAKGDVNLCQQGGVLNIDTPTDPSIFLREGGDVVNYGRIYDVGSYLAVQHYDAGDSSVLIDPRVGDGTSVSTIHLFNGVDTTGEKSLKIHDGFSTGNVQHEIQTGWSPFTGNVRFCIGGGRFAVGEGGGYSSIGAPDSVSAPSFNGSILFHLDEVGHNLKIEVKYSDGTTKTGTLALT